MRMDFPPSHEVGSYTDKKEGSNRESMSEMGQANSHSAQGMIGGSLALKPRRKHVASGASLRLSRSCGGHDPQGGDLHTPQLLLPVCPVWSSVR